MMAGRATGATSTIVGVAAQAASFNPLVTAVMAVALCGSLFVLRFARRRVDERRAGPDDATPASSLDGQFPAEPAPKPTEWSARR